MCRTRLEGAAGTEATTTLFLVTGYQSARVKPASKRDILRGQRPCDGVKAEMAVMKSSRSRDWCLPRAKKWCRGARERRIGAARTDQGPMRPLFHVQAMLDWLG